MSSLQSGSDGFSGSSGSETEGPDEGSEDASSDEELPRLEMPGNLEGLSNNYSPNASNGAGPRSTASRPFGPGSRTRIEETTSRAQTEETTSGAGRSETTSTQTVCI